MYPIADKISTVHTWDDLVLHPENLPSLNELRSWLNQPVKKRNNLKVIFHGPAGTGKRLTAAALGKEAGREVYRIDLSQVVSKYIGETEKNLQKIFETAKEKNWILFFDEADALFGKRTDVKDAHDKYANLTANFILKNLESFLGLSIFSLKSGEPIDRTSKGLVHQVIYFPIPDHHDRFMLWQNLLPGSHRLHTSINLYKLASQYEISGGSISNAVKFAALQANRRNDGTLYQTDLLYGIRKALLTST